MIKWKVGITPYGNASRWAFSTDVRSAHYEALGGNLLTSCRRACNQEPWVLRTMGSLRSITQQRIYALGTASLPVIRHSGALPVACASVFECSNMIVVRSLYGSRIRGKSGHPKNHIQTNTDGCQLDVRTESMSVDPDNRGLRRRFRRTGSRIGPPGFVGRPRVRSQNSRTKLRRSRTISPIRGRIHGKRQGQTPDLVRQTASIHLLTFQDESGRSADGDGSGSPLLSVNEGRGKDERYAQ